MIQLHYSPGNASFAPHLLLEELDTPFELQYVDRTVGAHKQPAYLKLDPNGLIPVLVDGDLVLYETAAICLHLADTHPQSGIAPSLGTPERAPKRKSARCSTRWTRTLLRTAGTGSSASATACSIPTPS